uniref:Myelin basic protein n=1 Tax=Meleagris gallopavo TaxID=9103 RepID=A0A803Y2L2_MELGA
MASQKRSSFRHGSKMASASTTDHARHGSPRHRDSGLLDSLGRFFGGDRHVPRRGFGKQCSYLPASHKFFSNLREPVLSAPLWCLLGRVTTCSFPRQVVS